ncbi:MAG: TonB-dependent receptor, partial [Bryobacteraceae bacterium]
HLAESSRNSGKLPLTAWLPVLRRAAALILAIWGVGLFNESQGGQSPGDQTGGDPLKQLSLEQLGNVEVTSASKEPEQVWRTTAAIYVITQDDIRRSGATSIPEALRLAPGVEVARIDSNTWAVGIRGFGSGFSKSVLVLIDGRSVYTPLYAGVYWNVENVMLQDVDRIEVIRGPGGTVWGANAVNGVINIITKKSKDSQGTLISAGGGNVDRGNGEFRYGGSFGENLSYRVYGMAFADGPEFHPNIGAFDDWQFGQGGFRLDWDDQGRDSFFLDGSLYKGEIGELANVTSLSPPSSTNVQGVQNVSGSHILGRWQHKLEGSDIQVQAYFDRTYRLSPQLGETRDTFDIDFIHHITFFPRQDIIWGLGARWSPSDFTQTVASINFIPQHQSDNIYSVFAQDEIAIIQDKLWATLGTKFEHNIYTGWEIQPSARLLWTPTAHQTFWAAVTRAVRTPSRLDTDLDLTALLTTSPLPEFVKIVGDPKFRSETLLGYEAGYRKLVTPRFYVDISLFHNNYDNLTSFGSVSYSVVDLAGQPDLLLTVPWANGIKGTTNGGEIAPDWKAAGWLELRATYSYVSLDLKNKTGNSDTGTVYTDESSSPRHQAAIQSFVQLPKGLELDPTFRYESALPAQGVQAYATMDARIGWHFARNLEVSMVGQNLFQPHHAEFSGDPGLLVGIKRAAYAQFTWRR